MKKILLFLMFLPLLGSSQEWLKDKTLTDWKTYTHSFRPDTANALDFEGAKLTKAYYWMSEENEMYDSIKFCFLGEAAIKTRTSTIYDYIEKLYDLSVTGDGTQTTEANQLYLIGNIAPSERKGILNPFGDTRSITVPTITITGTYTVTKCFDSDGKTEVTHTELTSGSISSITFTGKLYAYIVRSTALSTAQKAAESAWFLTVYPEIQTKQIGTQYWQTSNFDSDTTAMGNVITNVTLAATWTTSQTLYDDYLTANPGDTYGATQAAAMWCYYNNDSQLGAIYGKLYNWFAVSLIQQDIDLYNAANPDAHWGYHVPTSTEFTTLQTYLGGSTVAGGKMKIEGLDYWTTPNTGATNWSGFSALGAGRRVSDTGIFSEIKTSTVFRIVESTKIPYINSSTSSFEILDLSTLKRDGRSLRLIKD